ncbi:MAG: hypothetical protein HC810_08305 [Acaryochloridaceae cyanobacterium RL_2_7]|nr:hypothetical protein [Acaryochloridaceae cyanobacterium RL_2_7]
MSWKRLDRKCHQGQRAVYFLQRSARQNLRVALTNVTSGETLTKKYTKEGKGSFDFPVIKLGTGNGRQEVQYSIYNNSTEAVLEQENSATISPPHQRPRHGTAPGVQNCSVPATRIPNSKIVTSWERNNVCIAMAFARVKFAIR